jgi:hypothetical protein
MNKKFLSGTIFGLTLGLCVGVATPMIGATNKAAAPKPKDIVIKKNSFKANTITNPAVTAVTAAPADDMKEVVTILKEINTKLKENSDDNKNIIHSLKVLINTNQVNPDPIPDIIDNNEKK